MIGIGSAWGAISFVNALPTGIGAAAAISLKVSARVELTPSSGPTGTLEIPQAYDSALVRRSLLESLRRLDPGRSLDVRLSLASTIPPGRGLKSSSAIGVAIHRAVAAAARRSVPPQESAAFSSEIGRAVGVSATGAFDDASASALGGFVVADASTATVLRQDPPESDWQAVLWVPTTVHPPAPAWLDRFRSHAGEGRAASDAARAGRYLTAMERNTELVERVLGYDYRPLRRELERQGALGSGVSGMGPTLAAITRRRHRSKVSRAMPAGRGEVQSVEFVAPGILPDHGAVGE